MLLFQMVTTLLVIINTSSQSTEPTCATRLSSSLSGTDDDAFVEVRCLADEVMTSCMAFSPNDADGKRDGERIRLENGDAVCQALNGIGGNGVRAYARCCKWYGMQCSYPSTPSNIGDIDTYYMNNVSCQNDSLAVGCLAYSMFSCIKGASPGISAITSYSIGNNPSDEVNSKECRAYSCRSVTPTAACCSAPNLQCQVRTSQRQVLASVNCYPGWTMTGCNVHSSNETIIFPQGAQIENDVCSVLTTGSEGIWAVAVCCRTVDAVYTTDVVESSINPSTTEVEHFTTSTSRTTETLTTIPVYCPALEATSGASITDGSMAPYYYGDAIIFACLDGYEMQSGDKERVCKKGGQWSGTDIKCSTPGIYVPQYALFIAGGGLLLIFLCFVCLIVYKIKHQPKPPKEGIYYSSSSIRSEQSSIFVSPIYEELPTFALFKNKTLPSRPPALPSRSPSCSAIKQPHHEAHSLNRNRRPTRPKSMPAGSLKHIYVKKRSKSPLYDDPPIEEYMDPHYELPRSDPPPPPPPPPDTPRPQNGGIVNLTYADRPINTQVSEL